MSATGRALSRETVFAEVLPLIEAGFAVHVLRAQSKAPVEAKWSESPVHTAESFKESYRTGANVGLRLGTPSHTGSGYAHVVDLDIRKPESADEAWAAMRAMWPGVDKFPMVISGSGGESRHVYCFCSQAFRSRKLAKSEGFEMVFDRRLGRDVKKNDWEMELFGTGKQVAIPPSIHPDTGKAYVWKPGVGIDPEDLDLGLGPTVSPSLVASWGAQGETASGGGGDDEDDDEGTFGIFEHALRFAPMGLTQDEIDGTLAKLPEDWVEDRDRWLEVGQALHHEYKGSVEGFTVWCEWSEQSEKFNLKDSRSVWRSFKNRTRKPVRMASLIHAVALDKVTTAHEGLVDDDEDDGLPPPGRAMPITVPDDLADMLDGPPALAADDLSDILGEAMGSSGEGEVEKLGWRHCMTYTDKEEVKPGLHNVRLIIENDPRLAGRIAYNEFRHRIVLTEKPAKRKLNVESPKPLFQFDHAIWQVPNRIAGTAITDSHEHALRIMLETPTRQGGYNIKTSKMDLSAAVDFTAQKNSYHPVRDRLDALHEKGWSGIEKMDHLFVDFLGCPDDAYHRLAARMILLGAVARIYEPGHKFDFVPILEGPQGIKKSTFIRTLAMGYSGRLSGDFSDRKSMVEQMLGNWILEIPELQGFNRHEVTQLKDAITELSDNVRLSYEKHPREFPRQCVFIGSTNDRDYLRDVTGNRRYWPIRCNVEGEIDCDRLRDRIEDIWAEAVTVYKEMRAGQPRGDLPLYLADADAAVAAISHQEDRRIESEEEMLAGQIEHWINQPIGALMGEDELDGAPLEYRNTTCVKEIKSRCLGLEKASADQRMNVIVGRALSLVPGWTRGARVETKEYGRQWVYKRDVPLLPSPGEGGVQATPAASAASRRVTSARLAPVR